MNPANPENHQNATSPVRSSPTDKPVPLKDAIGLCLSGGGYRAMLFHLGTLWRLNDFAYLGKLDRISSVSGGSITAAVLGLHWKDIGIAADAPAPGFSVVVDAIRQMASHTIDVGSILKGIFGPGSVSDKIQRGYDEKLFHGATLQDFPDAPRFVLNATNVQSAAYGASPNPTCATGASARFVVRGYRLRLPWPHPQRSRQYFLHASWIWKSTGSKPALDA